MKGGSTTLPSASTPEFPLGGTGRGGGAAQGNAAGGRDLAPLARPGINPPGCACKLRRPAERIIVQPSSLPQVGAGPPSPIPPLLSAPRGCSHARHNCHSRLCRTPLPSHTLPTAYGTAAAVHKATAAPQEAAIPAEQTGCYAAPRLQWANRTAPPEYDQL